MKVLTPLILSILALTTLYFAYYQYNKQQVADLSCGLTSHFIDWANKNGYASFDFSRKDLGECASYGGKNSQQQTIDKIPVVFIHGNSDKGFGDQTIGNFPQTGFRRLATYLSTLGWSKKQLYTTTWGVANTTGVSLVYHKKEYVMIMRKFLEAVLQYTGAPQVALIGHSMGVTIARRIAKGGKATDRTGSYNVGQPLTNKIKTFVGLAGANLGLTSCVDLGSIPTCSNIDGFNPGSYFGAGPSTYLKQLNSDGISQAQKVYTIWGQYDTTIGISGLVYGKVTCRINDQIGQVKQTSPTYNHFAIRDDTGPQLVGWL